MKAQLLRFLKNYNSVILKHIIVILVLWFLAAKIPFDNIHPFAPIFNRILLVLFACIIINIKLIKKLLHSNRGGISSAGIKIKTKAKNLSSICLNTLKITFNNLLSFINKSNKLRSFQKTEKYILFGNDNDETRQLLKSTNGYFINKRHFGKSVDIFFDYPASDQWCYTHDTVYIPLAYSELDSNSRVLKICKGLRKCKKLKPISGIIITYNITDLMIENKEQRQNKLNKLTESLNNISRNLNIKLPIYCVFSRCDLIAGFIEFFNDLSQEELTQIWGITLAMNHNQSRSSILENLSFEYKLLTDRCEQRALWALANEKSEKERELIQQFPQQLKLLKQHILNFVYEIYLSMNRDSRIQFRGIYFTSCFQGDKPYDFIQNNLYKSFAFAGDSLKPKIKKYEAHFTAQIFQDLLPEESPHFGLNLFKLKLKRFEYYTTLLGAPLFLLTSFLLLIHAYHNDVDVIKKTNASINTFNVAYSKLNQDDRDIAKTVPVLNILHESFISLNSSPTVNTLLFRYNSIREASYSALLRSVQSLYLPRIAANLESQLQQSTTENNNMLYALLKGYLAFSPSHFTVPTAIIAPLYFKWNNQAHINSNTLRDLKYYINLASTTALPMLPLNKPLINLTRNKLATISPSKRAYGLLKVQAASSNINSATMLSLIPNYESVFTKDKTETIDALYTKQGYAQVFYKQRELIAKQVSNDNKQVGLQYQLTQNYNQILKTLENNYNSSYIQHWTTLISNAKIINTASLDTLTTLIKHSISINSPMKRLLMLINKNTSAIESDNLTISTHYTKLNNVVTDKNDINYTEIQHQLSSLLQYLEKIQSSSQPNKASYSAIASFINTDSLNPISKIITTSNQTPQPVKSWMRAIAYNALNILRSNAFIYLNNQWENKVFNNYQSQIFKHYPINMSSHDDISIADFNQFFTNNGTLESFVNHYLSSVIEKKEGRYSNKSRYNFSLKLSNKFLNAISQADNINKEYFSNNNAATMTFSLTPYTLSASAQSIQVDIGNQSLEYNHGPRIPVTVTWPQANDNQTANLTIVGFNQAIHSLSFNGPWSLFRLINNTHVNIVHKMGSPLMQIRVGGQLATFQLNALHSINTLNLNTLKHFSLPVNLNKKGDHGN